jgi:hypothetical protein
MSHWKGKRVQIVVVDLESKEEVIVDFEKFLDTDTMADVFDEFDPLKFGFIITPFETDEEIG